MSNENKLSSLWCPHRTPGGMVVEVCSACYEADRSAAVEKAIAPWKLLAETIKRRAEECGFTFGVADYPIDAVNAIADRMLDLEAERRELGVHRPVRRRQPK